MQPIVSPIQNKIRPQIMLVPSLACQASCAYCFGPHQGARMTLETLESGLEYIAQVIAESTPALEPLKVTFHGGEPLLAGFDFMQHALQGLHRRFSAPGVEVTVQSNLWLLDDAFCQLFQAYGVHLGTSLDGPETLNDQQRGQGYFRKTWAGIERARKWGLKLGCIATLTTRSLSDWSEISEFFRNEQLPVSLHAAIPKLGSDPMVEPLSSKAYAAALQAWFQDYLQISHEMQIHTFDHMIRGFYQGQGQICTFRECLGMFLAIDPTGAIYPCQRFCGQQQYALGNVRQKPGLTALWESPMAKKMLERQAQVKTACGTCEHLTYCQGGCTYNAWTRDQVTDPHCSAYRAIFTDIREQLLREFAKKENVAVLVNQPAHLQPELFHVGPVTELAKHKVHPSQTARAAKRIVAAVELARTQQSDQVIRRLLDLGLCRTEHTARASLDALKRSLGVKSKGLNNLYIHLTFTCQLQCEHCYVGESTLAASMDCASLGCLLQAARAAGFRQTVLTGGEPLLHPQSKELFDLLVKMRTELKPMKLMLRTNLAMELSEQELVQISQAVDQVVVSVDGDERSHNARRGQGTYQAVKKNLFAYQAIARRSGAAELSLAAVLPATQVAAAPGHAVRALADQLQVKRVRFRPLLPLGRSRKAICEPEALRAYESPLDLIRHQFQPMATCGLGQNLYIEPDGNAFPCYAYHAPQAYLGNVIQTPLAQVLDSPGFRQLADHTVDTNPVCRVCSVRYVCGGACRAWTGDAGQTNLDAPPRDCKHLKQRAWDIYTAACNYLGIPEEI